MLSKLVTSTRLWCYLVCASVQEEPFAFDFFGQMEVNADAVSLVSLYEFCRNDKMRVTLPASKKAVATKKDLHHDATHCQTDRAAL